MSLIQLRKPKKSIRASKKGNDKDNKTAITHLLTVEPQDTQGTEYPLEEEIFLGQYRAWERIYLKTSQVFVHMQQ